MPLTIKEVEHIAFLGRLNLTEEEKRRYAKQLGEILEYVEQLKCLPTDEVEPLAHVLPLYNITRPDVSRDSLPSKELLANAPEEEEGQFKVPKII